MTDELFSILNLIFLFGSVEVFSCVKTCLDLEESAVAIGKVLEYGGGGEGIRCELIDLSN